ncbi:MAG: hypothetical protein KGZ58_02145 [Ignavibacteriales bacterium]|nr:hypothetical protein [Ignavibacteriales bacterium]
MQTLQQQPLTNLQLELLILFSRNVPEQDLLEIKKFLVNYFAEKAMDAADRVWDEKGWTKEEMEQMAGKHFRTPYKQTHS